MERRIKHIIAICLFLIGLSGLLGCGSPSSASMEHTVEEGVQTVSKQAAKEECSQKLVYECSMELKYAKNFSVDYFKGGYTLLTTSDKSRFLLIPEGKEKPADLEADITVLQKPIENLYIVATAVMDMFCELDSLDAIRFSSQKEEGWYIEEARQAMESGDIFYAGKYSMPDYELIVSKGCSLAIQNTMISHSPEVIDKLKEFGIPVMIDYASYESHPLGRVEWVKFYGALLGKEEKAEEIFERQVDILNCIDAAEKTDKTVAFFYITANGTVNVRKSSDYVPKMIELAGGRYIFEKLGSESDNRSSVNMSMEEFYAAAKEADILIYNSTTNGELKTVDELLDKSGMFADFKAVKEGNVWCTTADLYQESMSVGDFIEDIHSILYNESTEQKTDYIYKLL